MNNTNNNINDNLNEGGILLIDKKQGISSFDIIRHIKRAFREHYGGDKALNPLKKIGHSGTLDPIATGLVIILLNKATKKAQEFLGYDKTYIAELLIGEATDSYDTTGNIINKTELDEFYFDQNRNLENLTKAIESFKGEIMQEPPMYSALKKNGVPLYEMARQGISIEREKRKCNIYNIEILKPPFYAAEKKGFKIELKVACSKGTYIRSLCRDIGEKIGIPSVMSGLRRTSTGGFFVENAIKFDEISLEKIINAVIKCQKEE
ncbi:MAG: tRNA pseudouridine(55) synthase TruB [Candidatus Wallbacteria bacterium]